MAEEHDVDYDYFKLLRYRYGYSSGDTLFDTMMNDIQHHGGGCYSGVIPYRGPGYLEGEAGTLGFYGGYTVGDEVVYDFATFQRANFHFTGGFLSDSVGGNRIESVAVMKGFKNWKNVNLDYRDWFLIGSIGIGTNFYLDLGLSVGKYWFAGIPDPSVRGTGLYIALTAGINDVIPILEPTVSATISVMDGRIDSYVIDNRVDVGSLLEDIRYGVNSPWKVGAPAALGTISEKVHFKYWLNTWVEIHKYRDVYEDVHEGVK